MKIIKSIEQFKKVFENDVQNPSQTPSESSLSKNSPDKKPGVTQNSQKNGDQKNNSVEASQSKQYYYNGKKIEGIIKDGKLTTKTGTIKLEDAKEIGEKVNKINELKPYFYYVQNVDNINYRVVKVVGVKDNVIKLVYKKDDKEVEIELDFNKANLFRTVPEKQDEEGFAQSKKKTQEKPEEKKEVELPEEVKSVKQKVDKVKDLKELPKDEISKILQKGENDEKTKVKVQNEEGKEIEVSLATAIKMLKKDMEKTSKSNESFGNKNEYRSILEAGTGLSYQIPTGNPGTEYQIKQIWESFFGDWDDREIFRVTQREADEVQDLAKKKTADYSLDVSKRPDPIVSIVRVYNRAHELYFTDVIPSGRPNGRVSPQTYREYIQLGTNKKTGPDEQATGGPYAVKTIYRQWRNGVLKILQDQKYRKVLANVNFVVPGAKDMFNKEKGEVVKKEESLRGSYIWDQRIFEDTPGDTLKRGESSGQILLEFMTEMLNPKKLDDFETLESELLNKYFGLNVKKLKIPEVKPTTKEIPENEKDNNHLKWNGFENWNKFENKISNLVNTIMVISGEGDLGGNIGTKPYLLFGKYDSYNSTDKTVTLDEVYFCDDFKNAEDLKDEVISDSKTFDNFQIPNFSTPQSILGKNPSSTKFTAKIKFKDQNDFEIKLTDKNDLNNWKDKVLPCKPKPVFYNLALKEKRFYVFVLKEYNKYSKDYDFYKG